MDIRKYLLTWEEYNEKEFKIPYVFKIEKENQILTYFGAKHTNDKNHQQFTKLKELWEEFLENKNENKIVIKEGGYKGDSGCKSEDEAIKRGGEARLISYLGETEGIKIISPEPETKYVFEELNKKFSQNEILYNRAGSVLLQWNRQLEKPDIKEYVERFLKRDCESCGWNDCNYERIQKIHKELFNEELNPENNNHFYKHIAPNEFNSVINEISREEDIYRDTSIVDSILDYWNKGYSIFIVYGSGHALIQEPALRKLAK